MKTEYIVVTGDPATGKTTFVRDNFQNRKDIVIFEDVCKLTKFQKKELKILKDKTIVFVVQKQNLETFFKSLPKSIVITKIIDLSAPERTPAMKLHDYQIKEIKRFEEYLEEKERRSINFNEFLTKTTEDICSYYGIDPKELTDVKSESFEIRLAKIEPKRLQMANRPIVHQMGRITQHGTNQPIQGRSIMQDFKAVIADDQEKLDAAFKNGREKARIEFSETLMQERKIYQQGINDYFDARMNKLQKENTKLRTDVRYYKAGIWIFFAVIVIQAILKNI